MIQSVNLLLLVSTTLGHGFLSTPQPISGRRAVRVSNANPCGANLQNLGTPFSLQPGQNVQMTWTIQNGDGAGPIQVSFDTSRTGTQFNTNAQVTTQVPGNNGRAVGRVNFTPAPFQFTVPQNLNCPPEGCLMRVKQQNGSFGSCLLVSAGNGGGAGVAPQPNAQPDGNNNAQPNAAANGNAQQNAANAQNAGTGQAPNQRVRAAKKKKAATNRAGNNGNGVGVGNAAPANAQGNAQGNGTLPRKGKKKKNNNGAAATGNNGAAATGNNAGNNAQNAGNNGAQQRNGNRTGGGAQPPAATGNAQEQRSPPPAAPAPPQQQQLEMSPLQQNLPASVGLQAFLQSQGRQLRAGTN